jgi:hypothetical protein
VEPGLTVVVSPVQLMDMDRFPYLRDFLGGYFHQDAYDEGQDDEGIIDDFKTSSWPFQRLGVRADIGRFLHEHREHVHRAFERTFSPGVTVARSDDEARAWLQNVEQALTD